MAVDIDGLAVLAVAGEVGDIVLAVEFRHAPDDGVERAVEHEQFETYHSGSLSLYVAR